MSEQPLVSIIVPVWNGEDYLQQALESALASTYTNIEIIIVNDGSTDGSASIAESVMNNNPKQSIRLHHQENSGEATAINVGVSLTQGLFLLVLSADDLIGPELVDRAVEKFRLDPKLGGVYPDWLRIDSEGSVIGKVQVKEFSVDELIGKLNCLPGPGTVIRRSALLPGHLRNPLLALVSDYECWLRLCPTTQFARLPGYHASWRDHDESTSRKLNALDWSREMERALIDFFQNDSEQQFWHLKSQALAAVNVQIYKNTTGLRKLLAALTALSLDPKRIRCSRNS